MPYARRESGETEKGSQVLENKQSWESGETKSELSH
jgi:hypothetical protein